MHSRHLDITEPGLSKIRERIKLYNVKMHNVDERVQFFYLTLFIRHRGKDHVRV